MKLLIALIALISIQCVYSQGMSHYGNPFKTNCRVGESKLGNQSSAACAASCDSNSCPYDYPSASYVTPTCLLPNAYGNRFCALRCTSSSRCPYGARCYKIGMTEEKIKVASRDRTLQRSSTNVCLYDNYMELPGELLLDE